MQTIGGLDEDYAAAPDVRPQRQQLPQVSDLFDANPACSAGSTPLCALLLGGVFIRLAS